MLLVDTCIQDGVGVALVRVLNLHVQDHVIVPGSVVAHAAVNVVAVVVAAEEAEIDLRTARGAIELLKPHIFRDSH